MWQNLAIMGLVVALAYFAWQWYDQKGDSGISLYLIMEDGNRVPIGDGKTLSIQALSIYYDGQKIQGIGGVLNLKPTLASGEDESVAIHWTGNWKIVGYYAGTNTVIFERPEGYWPKAPDPTNIPTNAWTDFSDYPAAFTEAELQTMDDGEYTFVWAASGTASFDDLTANWSVEVHANITKVNEALYILEDIIRTSFDVLS